MKPEYEIKGEIISSKNIEGFTLVNPRRRRQKQVMSIYRALCEGKHFQTPLVINRDNGFLRVIDGCHRLQAIEKYLEKFPEEKITVFMAVYKNLDVEEERKVYTIWNIPVRQSSHDFINSYKETIPMFHRLTKEIPVTIYGSASSIRLKNIADAYFSAQRKTFTGGVKYSNIEIVQKLQELRDWDVDTIVETFNIIYKSFNPMNRNDFAKIPAFKTTPFTALFVLIHKNKGRLGEQYILKKLSNLQLSFIEKYNQSGMKNCKQAHTAFQYELNYGIKNQSKHFI